MGMTAGIQINILNINELASFWDDLMSNEIDTQCGSESDDNLLNV